MELTSPADIEAAMTELAALRVQANGVNERERKFIEEIKQVKKSNATYASDRDHWKARAEKAEAAVNGRTLAKAISERDALRGEVSHLSKEIVQLEKRLLEMGESVGATAKSFLEERRNNESFKSSSLVTLEAMQKARDKAQIDRDNAVGQAKKLAEDLEKAKKELAATEKSVFEIADRSAQLSVGLSLALQTIRHCAEGGRYQRYVDKDGKKQDPAGVNGCLETLPKLLSPEAKGGGLS